jgi:hypothetical protein
LDSYAGKMFGQLCREEVWAVVQERCLNSCAGKKFEQLCSEEVWTAVRCNPLCMFVKKMFQRGRARGA